MKFLHLSDLHLGRRLCELDLFEDQAHILAQCVEMASQNQVDGVLVAGDIYDRNVPTVGAVNLLDEFLSQLNQLNIPVYLISGNHDSADRLGFGSRLLASRGVYLASSFEGRLEHYQLEDEHGTLHLWALPFIRPSMVRSQWPQEQIDDYTQAVEVVIRHAQLDPSARNVLMAHQFVTASGRCPETCDSESLSLGTLDHVEARAFDGFDYVALGHLHGPQQVGRPQVRYSGSPLAYSVSEVHHKKSAVLVELGPKGQVECKQLPFAPLRPLRQLKGPLEQLLEHAQPSGDYIHAILTDEQPPLNAAPRLRSVYPNLVKLDFAPKAREQNASSRRWQKNIHSTSPLELFGAFYESVHHRPMNAQEQTVMEQVFEELKGEEQ